MWICELEALYMFHQILYTIQLALPSIIVFCHFHHVICPSFTKVAKPRLRQLPQLQTSHNHIFFSPSFG